MEVPDSINRIPFNYGRPDCPQLSVGDILEAVIVEPLWDDVDLRGRKIYFHVFKACYKDPQLIQIYSPENWEIGPAFLEMSISGYVKHFPWERNPSDENANLIVVSGNWPIRTRAMRFFLLENYKQGNHDQTHQ
jgi:hypothetical protein